MTHASSHGLPAWPHDALSEVQTAFVSADSAAAYIRAAAHIDAVDSLLVLGTGWRDALNDLTEARGEDDIVAEVAWRADAVSVPGFVEPHAPQNNAELSIVQLRYSGEDEPLRTVLIHTGRVHVYDGFGIHAPAHSVRVAAALGAERALLTSDCGALRDDVAPGTPMLIRDHVNPTFSTPLVGARFVDLRGMWSLNLAEAAREYHPELREATFAFVPGPQYQTPGEVRMLRATGADIVGMSTVPEALAARERGMEIVGLSIVSSAETSDEPNDPLAVLREARRVTSGLGGLLQHVILAD